METNLLHAILIGLAIPIALYLFGKEIEKKYRLMKALSPVPDPITEHGKRIKEVFSYFLGQKKLFQETAPGWMHALIFWGFCILLLRAVTLFGMAFAGIDFHLPLLGMSSITGKWYSLLKDAANMAVLVMVLYAMFRRYILGIPRLLNTSGALFVLLMITGLMISDMLFEGSIHASKGGYFTIWSPIGSLIGGWMLNPQRQISQGALFLGHLSYLVHCLGILIFLVYLPMGKHMHIVSSLFNIYLRPLNRSGRLTKLDMEDESIETFGAAKIEDFTWKDALDMFTCTECGRCNDVCPANRTGKKLAPREITVHQNHFLQETEATRLLSNKNDHQPSKDLIPDVISPEEIWSCTTCYSCEQACPVNISYVQRINSMRRSEVLMKGLFPSELKKTFRGMETNSNPWGIGANKRMEWAKDLDLPVFSDHPNPEYLLFLGCAASFDERAQQTSRALISVLRKLNISFGVLGTEEQCCGETARRLGEENLGQTLITGNIELFKELGVKKILTLCPHCFNTFKNEYRDFGGHYDVIHHSQLIASLIDQGKLFLDEKNLKRVVIHDSCYMGRVNGQYHAPRAILNAITRLIPVEPSETAEKGFCCGAGGGLYWMEEHGDRINQARFLQLMGTEPDEIATSCPYCLFMLSDAANDLGRTDIKVKDLIQFIADSLPEKPFSHQ